MTRNFPVVSPMEEDVQVPHKDSIIEVSAALEWNIVIRAGLVQFTEQLSARILAKPATICCIWTFRRWVKGRLL
jgi:hypothetical protein